MKFIADQPLKPEKLVAEQIHLWMEDCGGHEGVRLALCAKSDTDKWKERLLAVDPHGNVWVGGCLHVKLGHFKEDGSFLFEGKFQ